MPGVKKSNQKKRHPGERALRVRERGTGFSTARPVLAKNWLASMPATLRAFLHPFAALYGAPV